MTKKILNVIISTMLNTFSKSIINLVYPPICVGCNQPCFEENTNIYLCQNCYLDIARHTPPFCSKCGRGLTDTKSIQNGICSRCTNRIYFFDKAWSICRYEGLIEELIHKFKYNQKIQYETIFKQLFNEFLGAFKVLDGIDLVVPIPLHPTRLREREYNQSQILANIISQTINKPLALNILMRTRNTKSQVCLDEIGRKENITGCFSINKYTKLENKSILLVDDVFTTGVTLSEAARTFKDNKLNRVFALTLAS